MLETWRIRKGDRVVVMAGRDKGRISEVKAVVRKDDKVLVEGVNMVTKHVKPSAATAGGRQVKESPIHVSNVMHADPKDDKPTRIGMKFLKDGRKVRFAKRSGTQIDK